MSFPPIGRGGVPIEGGFMKAGEWTLRSRRVVTPSGIRAADIVIRDEIIAALLEYDGPETEGVVLDVGDLAVLPGLVALHRQGSEALDEGWFEAVTRESGAGGVTTLVDLPPSHPDGSPIVADSMKRMALAAGKIRVDCGLVLPLGRGNVHRIESWIEAGFLGVEARLQEGDRHSASLSTEADLRAAMPILAELDRPLFVHSGRIGRLAGRSSEVDRFGSTLPDEEFAAIRLLIRLCRETRCRVHLIHPTASEALPMIAEARAEGLRITVATSPYHLGFAHDEIVDGVPTFPVESNRRRYDIRDRLWEGLESGLIDSIGPDLDPSHTPSINPLQGKLEPSRLEPCSLRHALPAVWAEAWRRGFTLEHLARWMAGKASAVVGLEGRKGSIVPGLDADLVVFDPEAITLPVAGKPHETGQAGPAEGKMLAGQVAATILRGTLIYKGGRFFEHPTGSVVLRIEVTQPIPGTQS